MGVIIKNIVDNLKRRDALSLLIIINVIVFLFLAIINVITILFDLPSLQFREYIAVSSNIGIVLTHIWTVATYMFVHYDFLHILFNMLMLFWFGRIFIMYFTYKNLTALYFLGGIAGAVFYVLLFNTIPYFLKLGDSLMVGASASVMAIVFASAFYNKNQEVRLFLLGSIKIYYIAIVLFILDFIALGGNSNQGGHVAHIGGAIVGYLFAIQYKKGKDITKYINRFFDSLANLFKAKPKMKVKHGKRSDADYEYNQRKHNEVAEIDRILDKIKQSGYKSLSSEEKKRLFDASNK